MEVQSPAANPEREVPDVVAHDPDGQVQPEHHHHAHKTSSSKEKTLAGRYRIGKTIGEGSFGKVKAGRRISDGLTVAIKVLDRTKIKKMEDMERVVREMNILKSLKHPHIVELYEVIHTDDHTYFVMEFVDGGELFEYLITHGKMKEREARRFFTQIIAGVEYCHRRQIIHRDLKPENLLLTAREKTIKIIDFGLCQTTESYNTLLKTPCGSPSYAAPEMLAGRTYYGAPVDVWSLGVILFALLTGTLPFADENFSKLRRKICELDPVFPDHLSDESKSLLSIMLCKDPAWRATIHDINTHPWVVGRSESGALPPSLMPKDTRRRSSIRAVESSSSAPKSKTPAPPPTEPPATTSSPATSEPAAASAATSEQAPPPEPIRPPPPDTAASEERAPPEPLGGGGGKSSTSDDEYYMEDSGLSPGTPEGAHSLDSSGSVGKKMMPVYGANQRSRNQPPIGAAVVAGRVKGSAAHGIPAYAAHTVSSASHSLVTLPASLAPAGMGGSPGTAPVGPVPLPIESPSATSPASPGSTHPASLSAPRPPPTPQTSSSASAASWRSSRTAGSLDIHPTVSNKSLRSASSSTTATNSDRRVNRRMSLDVGRLSAGRWETPSNLDDGSDALSRSMPNPAAGIVPPSPKVVENSKSAAQARRHRRAMSMDATSEMARQALPPLADASRGLSTISESRQHRPGRSASIVSASTGSGGSVTDRLTAPTASSASKSRRHSVSGDLAMRKAKRSSMRASGLASLAEDDVGADEDVRSYRGAFHVSASSDKPPAMILAEVKRVLDENKVHHEATGKFELTCNAQLEPGNTATHVRFEVEVCKLHRFESLHVVRFTRRRGDSMHYKAVCYKVVGALKL